mmetsp:Transcript_136810/g.424946  ORF Transcript_136810/g.424946 Transcript_136810/m.424946 type:complete len:449 (+) Transcript_136810:59-1405(+)
MALAWHLSLLASVLWASASASWAGLQSDEAADGPGLGLVQRSMELRGGGVGASASSGQAARDVPLAPAVAGTNTQLREMFGLHRESHDVPQLYVDLDEEPERRWRNVTRYYKDLGVFPAVFGAFPDIPPEQLAVIRSLKVDEDIRREIRGIVADIDHPKATEELILAVNIGYEMSGLESFDKLLSVWSIFSPAKGCSGLLAAMPNGTVVHGRNMDYSGFEATTPSGRVLHWPEVTAETTFLRGGKPLFLSVQWPIFVGVHTGMRFGGWTYEQNTRFHLLEPDVKYGLQHGGEGFGFVARRLLETTPDFESAVQEIYSAKFMAPMYHIMAGPGLYEGAVITSARGGEHPSSMPLITRLSDSLPAIKDGMAYQDWKVIQTNDDQGHAPLDHRRPVENAKLTQASQESISTSWMFNQMLDLPLFQFSTVFTTVFVPASGYHRTLAHFGSLR